MCKPFFVVVVETKLVPAHEDHLSFFSFRVLDLDRLNYFLEEYCT